VLSTTERLEKIGSIRNLPAVLEGSVKGLKDTQLDTPYRTGGWTVRQVVHHIADSHLNAFIRMKLILTEDRPTLKPYDQDKWAKLPDVSLPIGSSLAIVRGLHERWVFLLEGAPESSWNRSALHPEVGEITLESLLLTYAHHGQNHVQQISKLRTVSNW
jgi:hypothetical protein